MNRGAVVALLEVLLNEFPVRRHRVVDPPASHEPGQVIAGELGLVPAQPGVKLRSYLLLKRHGIRGQVQPDQPVELGQVHRVQPVVGLVDVRHGVPVGRAHQAAV